MLNRNRLMALAVMMPLSLLLITAAGCSQHSGEKYYLVTANKHVQYWQTARAGLDDAAIKMKIPVDFIGPDSYDPKAEQDAFRRAVNAKASGIMISVADPTLMKSDIDAAIQQGIPVITIDSDVPGSKRLLFVGTNNFQAGQLGGEAVAKALNGKGSIVVFTMPGQTNLDERLQGYRATLAKYAAIKIDRVVDIKGNAELAFDTTKSMIDKKEKVDGFVCLEAQAGNEVAAVLSQNHISDKVVVAMDTDPDTIKWINKGVIAATVAQKPYTMAYFGLHVLDDLHHNPPSSLNVNWAQDPQSPLPVFVDTGVTLVTKDNVQAFLPKGQ